MVLSAFYNSLSCVRKKKWVSEFFRIASGVIQGCVISPGLFNIGVMGEGKAGIEGREVRFSERRQHGN